MRKKILTYFVISILTIGFTYSQKESGFKSERSKTFKPNGFKNDGKDPSKAPPNPGGGGGGGNPIPISTGALLLGIGLAGYATYKSLRRDAE